MRNIRDMTFDELVAAWSGSALMVGIAEANLSHEQKIDLLGHRFKLRRRPIAAGSPRGCALDSQHRNVADWLGQLRNHRAPKE